MYTRLYYYKCIRVFIVTRVYASIYACMRAQKDTFKIINENTRLPIAHVMYKSSHFESNCLPYKAHGALCIVVTNFKIDIETSQRIFLPTAYKRTSDFLKAN